MKRILLLSLALLLACGAFAQMKHLKRRGMLGIRPFEVNDSIAKAHKLKRTEGVLVGQVFPNTSFSEMGAEAGDIILQVNTHPIRGFAELRRAGSELWGGDPISVTLWRDGKEKKLKGKVVGMAPTAGTDKYDVEYGEVAFDGGYLRSIVSTPKEAGPHPAIYFIPGYTCASVDILSPIHPYRKLFDSLSTMGYVLYRIEKPGTGDGPSPCQCMETGFDKELTVFEAGYRDLLKRKDIDPNNVFLFGHSMGGVQAPLLAAMDEFNPKGVAVYGTVFQTWYEYILNMLRFQEPRQGEDYVEFEKDMQEYTKLLYEHYVLMKPLEQIISNPRWKALLERDFLLNEDGDILFRKSFFWRELAAVNLTEAWAKTNAHVLSLYGEADFEVFNEFSMSEIARIVNTYHPGKGKYVKVEKTDHSMIRSGTMEEAVQVRGTPAYRQLLMNNFNYDIITILDDWIKEVRRGGS